MQNNISQNNNIKKLTIDPDGDIYLELTQAELRVSSKVLRLASSVWKAMLSPRFKEGTTLKEDGFCRISLPDDNSDAMTLLCQILHHQPFDEKNHNEELFGQVAVLADKYDCVKIL